MSEIVIGVLIACALGWLFTITSGALFSYIVFRTKRETHETLFGSGAKGSAFVVDDLAGPESGVLRNREPDLGSKLMEEQTARFLEQFRKDKETMQ